MQSEGGFPKEHPGRRPPPSTSSPFSSKPGAKGTRNLINEVKPVSKSRQMISDAIKQPTEETPRCTSIAASH